MSVSAKYVNRKLLQNVLHHVDTHNRLMEEKDMWNSKRNQREGSNASDYDQRMGSSERRRSYGRMRSDDNETKSTTRDIVKLKEEMGKWNHTGFMELYPDEFLSRQSMDELSNGEEEGGGGSIKKKGKKKRRKRKNSDSNGLDKRKRKRTSEKKLNKDSSKKPRRSDPSEQWQERELTRDAIFEKPHKRRKSEDRTKRKKEKRKDDSKRKDKSKKHKKRRKKMKPDVEK